MTATDHAWASRDCIGADLGRMSVILWLRPRMWSLGVHSGGCCLLWLAVGPLEVMVFA
jgi:hypothetical protein